MVEWQINEWYGRLLMRFKLIEKWLLTWIFFFALGGNVFAETTDNLCHGAGALLNYTHRGSVADSPCVIPTKTVMVEAGYIYSGFSNPTVFSQNFPELILTLGLPADTQVVLFAPSYNQQTSYPFSGYDITMLDIKHQLFYNPKWMFSIDAAIIPPGGSAGFGSKEVSAVVSGILNYTINDQFSWLFELGASTISLPPLAGNLRFQTINPDFVFAYAPEEKLNFFAEIYGQTKTGPGQGSGYNADYGVLYLIRPTIAFDLEIGHPVSGRLDGTYIGSGVTIWLK